MKNTEQFEELFIPRRELHFSDYTLYRIYRDSRSFELVEASSAIEALSKSKIRKVYKVERHDPMADNVIHLKQVIGEDVTEEENSASSVIEKKEEVVELAAPSHVEAEKIEPDVHEDSVTQEAAKDEAQPEPAPAPAPSDAPLSNDEVDRLLNGG